MVVSSMMVSNTQNQSRLLIYTEFQSLYVQTIVSMRIDRTLDVQVTARDSFENRSNKYCSTNESVTQSVHNNIHTVEILAKNKVRICENKKRVHAKTPKSVEMRAYSANYWNPN